MFAISFLTIMFRQSVLPVVLRFGLVCDAFFASVMRGPSSADDLRSTIVGFASLRSVGAVRGLQTSIRAEGSWVRRKSRQRLHPSRMIGTSP